MCNALQSMTVDIEYAIRCDRFPDNGLSEGCQLAVRELSPRADTRTFGAAPLNPLGFDGDINTMKVLLVEDDIDMSRALSRALSARGFDVLTCFDGVNALRLIKENVAEVVLLDLSIPIIDGLHVLQRARAQSINTPVLILTARGAVGDRVAGLNAGADDYLSKPFDLEELEARL